MSKDILENEIINAFIASIRNFEYFCNSDNTKRGFIYKIKYITWFICLLIFSPRYKEEEMTFYACMTPINEKRLEFFRSNCNPYRFGKLNISISVIRKNKSVVSDLNFLERIKIFFEGLFFYIRHISKLRGYLHFTLEYYAISSFLGKKKFLEYITPGMYERYSTLFSYLGRLFKAKLVGLQDGAAIDINIPVKIYCDEMYAFDEFEANNIRKFLKNDNCKFIYTGFISVIKWDQYPRSDKKVMAIASQDWFTGKTIDLVESLMKSPLPESWDVILLPHYRETMDMYSQLQGKYPNLIIEPKKRYANVDLLITYYSTIVYDFWSVNKDLIVFCLSIPEYIPSYYDRNNVNVFNNTSDLIKAIKEFE